MLHKKGIERYARQFEAIVNTSKSSLTTSISFVNISKRPQLNDSLKTRKNHLLIDFCNSFLSVVFRAQPGATILIPIWGIIETSYVIRIHYIETICCNSVPICRLLQLQAITINHFLAYFSARHYSFQQSTRDWLYRNYMPRNECYIYYLIHLCRCLK